MSRFLSKASESLLPYTPGEQPQGRKFIKLNTNECPYPPSPKVAEAILAGYEENSSKIMPLELANLRLYSDPEERVLIEAIADHYGVGTNQVIYIILSDLGVNAQFAVFFQYLRYLTHFLW